METVDVKIPSAASVRAADAYTISSRQISSAALMYRAALEASVFAYERISPGMRLVFVCGPGNNGGDGLCMALVLSAFFPVQVVEVAADERRSADFIQYRAQLREKGIPCCTYPDWDKNTEGALVFDCLLGTGLQGAPRGIFAEVIRRLNEDTAEVWSIDLPSGMQGDNNEHLQHGIVVEAAHTLSFQAPRLSFFFPENEIFTGRWHVLDIGLDTSRFEALAYLNTEVERPVVSRFAYKNKLGKTLVVAGSEAMPGAALLAAGAALRSGTGYVYALVPAMLKEAIHIKYPQLICYTREKDVLPDLSFASAIGVGPGLGTGPESMQLLIHILKETTVPLLLDADALTLMAQEPSLWQYTGERTVITPHPGEFDRISGIRHRSGYERWQAQVSFSQQQGITIVLKGAYTSITSAGGKSWFNTTGTPGMAKAGSGDVLTGLLSGLLAQGMPVTEAARYAVFLHGRMGEAAAHTHGLQAMNAGDLLL